MYERLLRYSEDVRFGSIRYLVERVQCIVGGKNKAKIMSQKERFVRSSSVRVEG